MEGWEKYFNRMKKGLSFMHFDLDIAGNLHLE